MPRTKLSRRIDAEKMVKGTIVKYLSVKGESVGQCATGCGMGKSTLYKRLDHIGDLTLDEMGRLRTGLSIPKEELWSVLEGIL